MSRLRMIPTLTLLTLVACQPNGTDDTSLGPQDTVETGAPLEPAWEGERAGEGFGTALTWRGDGLWIGAPHGVPGRVYVLEGDALSIHLEGTGDDLLGFSLVTTSEDTVLIGRPWADERAGAIWDEDGEIVLAGSSSDARLGGYLAASETDLFATTATGWASGVNAFDAAARVPDAITTVGGIPVLGFAWGDAALQTEERSWGRGDDTQSELGYSLASGDWDGDGTQDLAVGAPGTQRVVLLFGSSESWPEVLSEALTIEGDSARFGHALATAAGSGDNADELWIGDPEADGGLGAVWRLSSPVDPSAVPTAEQVFLGTIAAAGFGASLALSDSHVAVAAVGQGESTGSVSRFSRPESP